MDFYEIFFMDFHAFYVMEISPAAALLALLQCLA